MSLFGAGGDREAWSGGTRVGHTSEALLDLCLPAVTELSPSSCPRHGKSISVMVFGWMRPRDRFPVIHGDPTVAHVQDRVSGDSDTR